MTSEKIHKFMTKVRKDYPDFVGSVEGMPMAELEKNLLFYSSSKEDVRMAKEADEKLQEALDAAKELAASYNDATNALKNKIKYIHLLVKALKGELELNG